MGLYQEDLRRKLTEIVVSGYDDYSRSIEAFRHQFFSITHYAPFYDEQKILSEFYYIGREFDLPLFFSTFVRDIFSRYHYDYERMIAFNRKRKRFWRDNLPTQKYVKNVEHKKKNKEKEAWRIEKQVKRDKAKRHFNRGPATYYKHLASKLSRRKAARLLKHDRWEDIDMQEKRWQIVDSWSWD